MSSQRENEQCVLKIQHQGQERRTPMKKDEIL